MITLVFFYVVGVYATAIYVIFYGLFLYFVFTLVCIDITSFHDNILWFIFLKIVFTFIIFN